MIGANQLAGRGGRESEYEIALARIGKDVVLRVGDELQRTPANGGDRRAAPPFLEDPQQAIEALHALRCFVRGRWKETCEACERAYTVLPAARGKWKVQPLAVYGEFARGFLGDTVELARRLPGLLVDAPNGGAIRSRS